MTTKMGHTPVEADDIGGLMAFAARSSALRADDLVAICHGAASRSGWWDDIKTGEDQRLLNNVPEKLMLIVSELGEAMEGHRKNLQDEHLPEYSSIEVELADALIRICDLAGAKGYRLGEATAAKLLYNAKRADHKPENRLKEGGKAY